MLDFWRGIAISLVLIDHLAYFRYGTAVRLWIAGLRASDARIPRIAGTLGSPAFEALPQIGIVGVMIFFIVSGYIITKLLLDEERISGAVSIPRFYARRAAKTLPPYLVYVAFVSFALMRGWVANPPAPQTPCLAFLANTNLTDCRWHFYHLWSISIEEQFYLVWPLLFLFVPPVRRSIAIGGASIIFLGLASFNIFTFSTWISNGRSFAAILVGILYALSPRFRRAALTVFPHAAAIVLATLAFARFPLPPHLNMAYFPSMILVLLGIIVTSYRFRPFVPAPLFAAVAGIGIVSYSGYIWQQIFMEIDGAYPRPSLLMHPIFFIPIVLASYFLIERPMAAWSRARFSVRRR